jgi:hypothetical protein
MVQRRYLSARADPSPTRQSTELPLRHAHVDMQEPEQIIQVMRNAQHSRGKIEGNGKEGKGAEPRGRRERWKRRGETRTSTSYRLDS